MDITLENLISTSKVGTHFFPKLWANSLPGFKDFFFERSVLTDYLVLRMHTSLRHCPSWKCEHCQKLCIFPSNIYFSITSCPSFFKINIEKIWKNAFRICFVFNFSWTRLGFPISFVIIDQASCVNFWQLCQVTFLAKIPIETPQNSEWQHNLV